MPIVLQDGNSTNDSTEQMPHLEPLNEPQSEVHSLHGPPPELAVVPHHAHGDRNIVGLVRNAMVSLKFNLVLENKGNVARDHLASERTYLAYVRTSLACASAGVASVQLFMSSSATGENLAKYAKPLGASIVLFGLVILVVGVVRYFSTQSALVRGHFPVARHSIMMIAFALGSLVSIVFGITVAGTKR